VHDRTEDIVTFRTFCGGKSLFVFTLKRGHSRPVERPMGIMDYFAPRKPEIPKAELQKIIDIHGYDQRVYIKHGPTVLDEWCARHHPLVNYFVVSRDDELLSGYHYNERLFAFPLAAQVA
jgi:hypothetical protein